MLVIFIGGLVVGILALVAFVTAGVVAEFLHWQNELIFHRVRPADGRRVRPAKAKIPTAPSVSRGAATTGPPRVAQ